MPPRRQPVKAHGRAERVPGPIVTCL